MLIKTDGRRSSRKNSTKLCPNINGKQEVTSKLEKQIKTPAGCCLVVIWQLSFSHLQSLNLEANLWLAKTGLSRGEDIGCNSTSHSIFVC